MNVDLPRLYLVRHGETAWTLTGQHSGRTDLPLTERGEQQARELEASLATLSFDRILSSPLQSARRTAELAVPNACVEEDDDLMEWDYGAYDGRRTADIEMEHPGWRLFRDGSPGGEMLDAVGARADRVIRRARAGGKNVLLFGHRELLRILAVRWMGLPPVEGRRLMLATGSLSALGYDHDLAEPVIHAWNGHPTAPASGPSVGAPDGSGSVKPVEGESPAPASRDSVRPAIDRWENEGGGPGPAPSSREPAPA